MPPRAIHRYETRLFDLVDSLTARGWLVIWLATVFGSAIAYWLITTFVDSHGLAYSNGEQTISFLDTVYFSFVTITTLGYGDIAPHGITRVIAIFEAVIGVFVVGALISKALSQNQERVLMETNELAFDERIARILTNIHFLMLEFQSICDVDDVTSHRVAQDQRRMDNAVWTLEHVLRAVGELLQHQRHVDPLTMRTILSTMGNTLQEYDESRRRASQHEGFKLANEVELVNAVTRICDHKLPASYPENVRAVAKDMHELAVSIFKS